MCDRVFIVASVTRYGYEFGTLFTEYSTDGRISARMKAANGAQYHAEGVAARHYTIHDTPLVVFKHGECVVMWDDPPLTLRLGEIRS